MSKNEDFTTVLKLKVGKFTIWGNLNCQNCGKISDFEMAAVASTFNLWTRFLVDVLVTTYILTYKNKIQKNL